MSQRKRDRESESVCASVPECVCASKKVKGRGKGIELCILYWILRVRLSPSLCSMNTSPVGSKCTSHQHSSTTLMPYNMDLFVDMDPTHDHLPHV